MVYLHSPRVFQSLMVLSRDPETIWRLSTEKATERTSLSCPTKRRVVFPVEMSQSLNSESQLAERAKAPSDEITTSVIKCECPRSARRGTPYASSSDAECVSDQTMTDLSRDDERSKLGSSGVVARLVTQSSWPLRVPRRVRFSAILIGCFFCFCVFTL